MLRGGSRSASCPAAEMERHGPGPAEKICRGRRHRGGSGTPRDGLNCPFSDNPRTNRCFGNRISLFSMIEFPVIEKQGIARQSIVMIAVFSGTSMPEGLKQECG